MAVIQEDTDDSVIPLHNVNANP